MVVDSYPSIRRLKLETPSDDHGGFLQAHTDYYSIKTKHYKALTEISSKHYKHNIGRSRRNRPVSHGSRPHTDRF
ncbi:hypothetical protein J6590_086817 [Homalodisca vitripennis]|nr:hypothetical protein J6590_086817 [Homalodisca vitripennis]